MKKSSIHRLALLLLLSLSLLPAHAKLTDKEMQKIAERFDVIDLVADIDRSDPVNFWTAVQNGNAPYQEARKAALKGKAKEAQSAIAEAVMYAKSFPQACIVEDNICSDIIQQLMSTSGIGNLYREAKLYLTYEPDENAYSYPGGDMYITAGLFLRLDGDPDLLTGIFAHEISHFVLQHVFTTLYAEKKRKKRDEIIKGISAAVSIGTATWADFQNAGLPNPPSKTNTEAAVEMTKRLSASIDNERVKYVFKYSKEQEYEADIIAYRFLEWLGIGGNKYIESLSLIRSDLEIFQNDESTHPLTDDRISLLRYLSSDVYAKKRASFEKKKKDKAAAGNTDYFYW